MPPTSARPPKAAYGELERAVLEVLWDAEPGSWVTVREVYAVLARQREVAYTTVMTVMDRLTRKDQIVQRRDGRAYLYRPRASRSEMIAELMRGTLSEFAEHDRQSALVAFVEDATPSDLAALRAALAKLEGS